jgi:hypothetical protein
MVDPRGLTIFFVEILYWLVLFGEHIENSVYKIFWQKKRIVSNMFEMVINLIRVFIQEGLLHILVEVLMEGTLL